MSELRKDPVTGRWVIISTERRKRPTDFRLETVQIAPDPSCPFCEGHETMTPPELLAVRHNGSRPNEPGWNLRVVPNQFPVLRVEGTLDRQGEGLFDKMNGIGAHEVIIESPRHEDTLATLDADRVEQVLWACRERISDLKRDQRFRYIDSKGFGANINFEYRPVETSHLYLKLFHNDSQSDATRFRLRERGFNSFAANSTDLRATGTEARITRRDDRNLTQRDNERVAFGGKSTLPAGRLEYEVNYGTAEFTGHN